MADDRTPDDELRQLLAKLPAPEPSADVTTRHRAELQAEIERTRQAAGPSDADELNRKKSSAGSSHAEGRRDWVRVLSAAAAVVIFVVAIAVVTSFIGTGDRERGITTNKRPNVTPTSTAPSLACGATLPQNVSVPAGFEGPKRRAVTDAPALRGDQLVLTWSKGDEDIEMRWPADANIAAEVGSAPPVPGPVSATESIRAPNPTATGSGRFTAYIGIRLPTPPEECQALELSVYGPNPGDVRSLLDTLSARPLVPADP